MPGVVRRRAARGRWPGPPPSRRSRPAPRRTSRSGSHGSGGASRSSAGSVTMASGTGIVRSLRAEGVDVEGLAVDPAAHDRADDPRAPRPRAVGGDLLPGRVRRAPTRPRGRGGRRVPRGLRDGAWLHLTGITPALSSRARAAAGGRARRRPDRRCDREPRSEPAPAAVDGDSRRGRVLQAARAPGATS